MTQGAVRAHRAIPEIVAGQHIGFAAGLSRKPEQTMMGLVRPSPGRRRAEYHELFSMSPCGHTHDMLSPDATN
jgi:hypothetical protein